MSKKAAILKVSSGLYNDEKLRRDLLSWLNSTFSIYSIHHDYVENVWVIILHGGALLEVADGDKLPEIDIRIVENPIFTHFSWGYKPNNRGGIFFGDLKSDSTQLKDRIKNLLIEYHEANPGTICTVDTSTAFTETMDGLAISVSVNLYNQIRGL